MNRQVQKKGDRHARVAEPVAREMVLQIPRGVHAEVPKESHLREPKERNREDSAGAARAREGRVGGGSRAVGPRAPVPEHTAEVQRGKHDWILEREVGDPDPPRAPWEEAELYGIPFLGARVLREHGRSGRRGDSRVREDNGPRHIMHWSHRVWRAIGI